MKWAIVRRDHINMNNVTIFKWVEEELYVWFVGEEKPAKWKDPDRKLYIKLCRQQGIRPYEED